MLYSEEEKKKSILISEDNEGEEKNDTFNNRQTIFLNQAPHIKHRAPLPNHL